MSELMKASGAAARASWPRLKDIREPRMVALYTANGSGTKLYQGFLDGHPQILMVPVYPLMYFYPHWHQWREELKDNWNWPALIDAVCVKHASLLDTRNIPGHDGLGRLGGKQDEFISIDETAFRDFLAHLLEGEPVTARALLLALHYAYAFCRGEDLAAKKVLVYHIHVHLYLPDYLFADFPDALVIGTVRDPRSNIRGRYGSSEVGVDLIKMNKTDALIFRRRVYMFIMRYMYEGLDILWDFPPERARMVRHEDLALRPGEVMRATAKFLGIECHPCMEKITFGGKEWWGDPVYDMEPMNAVNPNITSQEWKKRIDPVDWFVFEGLYLRYMEKYAYPLYKYRDGFLGRILLLLATLLPAKIERDVFLGYFTPSYFKDFLEACVKEARGEWPIKDYTRNAYYRHKWTQKDLGLYKPRWFVEALKSESGFARFFYIAVNLVRYVWAIPACAWMLVLRWRVTGAAYLRMVRGRNALPDIL